MAQRVLMAMSGGIDSSVAAMLLLEKGYELTGVTFRTFDSIKPSCLAKEKGCCSVESIMEARNLAHRLGFEHHIVDFRDVFREHVIAYFVEEYSHGRTPNPCVMCNSHIKWGVLLEEANRHKCDLIATGHYARIAQQGGHWFLRRAADSHKDQTYFLWMLTEENLSRTVFPLGDLTKDEVRKMAAERGFEQLSKKKESQEICFIPDNDYRSFLASEGCEVQEGLYVDGEGKVLGRHAGFQNYTIGQRKGLGVALGYPVFVTRIDAENNEVTLGRHDDLLQTEVRLREDMRFLGDSSQPVQAQIRYRSQPTEAFVDTGQHSLHFAAPVWAAAPGQSAVIYQDELLVGGGIII
ncbi:MAG: tRNA 2-thiouridine(34) synthase MnmA [Paludibacteraceae bacterium]|nr:tRNA 2-thiouridine(34) synthase MnmA [Paludibacteraceae bacterium]